MAGGANLLRLRSQFDDQASGKLNKLRDNFDRLGKSKGAQTVLQGVGMGLGISAWGLLDRAIGFVGETIQGSIAAASDQREAMALNAQVFEQNSEAVKEWARNQDDAFSQTDAITFAATFGTAFKNVGLALDDVTEKSKTLTTLAGDLSSTFNTASEEAATALRSGLLGESEPLRRFGIFLDEAKVKAKAAAMGMEILGGKLTDGQKVAARYALIMEQTADSQGMFGRDTGSLADAQKRLDSNLEDLSATLARDVIPALADVTNGLADLAAEATKDGGTVDQLAAVWADLSNSFDPEPTYKAQTALGELDRTLTDLTSDTIDFITPWDDWVSAADERKAAIDKITAGMGDFRDADRAAAGAARKLADDAGKAEGAIDALGDEAVDSAGDFKKLEKAADDALDAFLEATLGPEQLKIKLRISRDELGENTKEAGKLREKIGRMKEAGKPVGELKDDLFDLRGEILEDKEETIRLTARLESMGEIKPGSTQKTVERLLGTTASLTTSAWEAYRALDAVSDISLGRGAGPISGKRRGRASGGLVPAGGIFDVGEEGQETLVQFPGGGGYVIPNTGGQSSGGGTATVVHTQINLDGRTIARVVDRHLSYEAARAPRSASA